MTTLTVPLFERIQRGKNPGPRRTMLYGVQGVGKSTWGNMAPSAIFLPTEDGLRDIEVNAKFPLLTSYRDVIDAIRQLAEEKHEYRTVVVDTLDWLEPLVWEHVCEEHGQKSIESFGYGKGYTEALGPWRRFLGGLDTLRSRRGMSVVLLAHSKIERFEAPETASYDRYTPRLHKSAAGLVMEWCDEVFFACYKVMTKVEKGRFNAEKVKAIGDGERIMRTAERPFAMAKNRLGLPHEMPLDFRKYAEAVAAIQNGGAT